MIESHIYLSAFVRSFRLLINVDTTQTDLHIAALVRECIAAANYSRYPSSPEDWHEVARRLGIVCMCVPYPVGGAFLTDDLLIYEMGTPEQLARYFAHELAESRLRCECETPYVHPEPDGACHRVATLVETARTSDMNFSTSPNEHPP